MGTQSLLEQNQDWIENAWQNLDQKLSRLAERNYDFIPYTTKNGAHAPKASTHSIAWWTNGFWGGLMWLMYSETRKGCYLNAGRRAEEVLNGAWNIPEKLHHDVGFMWHLTSGGSFALTADKNSYETSMKAADFLLNRYNEKGDYIVAWNGEDKKQKSIIDTMMNLSLLYWASEQTGDPKYAEVAKKHADMALRDHIRPDGSVVHIVCHDTERPGVIETLAGQGYEVGSSWSRGASWAIYGFALSYVHTKEERYLDAAKRTAHYALANLALSDWLPLIDYRAPETPVAYDSTAGAITACGLIEIAKHVPELEKELYLKSALNILKAIETKFCNWTEEEDGILMGGSERYGNGENINIIYGDYYFAEAILKLKGNKFLPW